MLGFRYAGELDPLVAWIGFPLAARYMYMREYWAQGPESLISTGMVIRRRTSFKCR